MALISSLVEALFYFVCAVVTAFHVSTDSMAVSVSPSPVEYRCHAPLAPFVPLSFGGQKIQVNRLLHSSLLLPPSCVEFGDGLDTILSRSVLPLSPACPLVPRPLAHIQGKFALLACTVVVLKTGFNVLHHYQVVRSWRFVRYLANAMVRSLSLVSDPYPPRPLVLPPVPQPQVRTISTAMM